MAKVCLVSLGCPKNTVDAEEILGEAEKAGHEIENDPADAEVLIVNTCGFIQSAKEESIDAVLDAVRYKTNGACRSVIVTGCLAQRYGAELADEFPEADAVIGLKESRDIAEVISRTLSGKRVVEIGAPYGWWMSGSPRILSTPPWTAYLRIADGCDNRCTYCTIPSIRGNFGGRTEREVLEEARALTDLGVREINLVAQDITRFGQEIGEQGLPRLLDRLSEIDAVRWIRLLYCYPTRISDDLIRAVAENEKVCRYIDVPLQHCSEKILRAMNRQGGKREYLDLFARIRERCPDAALRTTFIVGFPGETEEEFAELMEFVGEVRFDRMGAFAYSPEDGTPAAELPNRVDESLVSNRVERLMDLQQAISLEKNRELIGSRIEVLVEAVQGKQAVGRTYRDAPEIDGVLHVEDFGGAEPGDFIEVEVTGAREHDLLGRRMT